MKWARAPPISEKSCKSSQSTQFQLFPMAANEEYAQACREGQPSSQLWIVFRPRGCKQTLNTTTAHMGDVLNIREPRYLRIWSSRSYYFGVGVGARLTHLALRLPGDTLKYPEEPILPLTSSKYDLRPYTGFLMRSCYDPRQLGSLGP